MREIHNFECKQITVLFIALVISAFIFVTPASALYEDQIGKFDWKQSYVGPIKESSFAGASNDHIIVATEENVLASLSSKTGQILWRRVFEKSERGIIRLLHVPTSDVGEVSADIITVSGTSPALIRTWDQRLGNIVSEWAHQPTNAIQAELAIWYYDDSLLYHLVPVFGSHIELTAYVASTGQPVKPTTTRIPTAWSKQSSCVLAGSVYACVVKSHLIGIDLRSDWSKTITKALPKDYSDVTPIALKGSDEPAILLDGDIFSLGEVPLTSAVKATADSHFQLRINEEPFLFAAASKENSLVISAHALQSGVKSTELSVTLDFPEYGTPRIVDVRCRVKPDKTIVCRHLLATEDGAIVLVQRGSVRWAREEALSRIVALEMIDLPLSDAEGSIENELKNKDGDIIGAMARRLTGQVAHLRNLILSVIGMGAPQSATQRAGLVRDSFGLHKILVIMTASGKMFGVDNNSGKHHWVKLLSNFEDFSADQRMKVLVQRTSGHYPLLPQCTVLAKSRANGNGILYQFNPITGQPISGSGVLPLNYAIAQMVLLHDTKDDFLRGILLFDQAHQVHVVPEKLSSLAHSLYLYSADKKTSLISGYYIEYAQQKLTSKWIWQLNLGGSGNTQKIVQVANKNDIERVHSQGRVFNDRSVLYKYINPNLVAVATIGPDNLHKTVLNVHLIDGVSGGIVSSLVHRRVREPLHIVHSENWLVYSYFNEKVRRTEVTTVELYEGKSQTNSTVWSSLDAPQLPMVERQSYVVPAQVVHLKETITEKGITNKHVLFALSSGSIVEMPWALLDPRRPILLPNQAREEGIIPYIPELQLPSENVINYNQSVANIRGIHTAPTSLESTCLVVAYGLDVFVTRVAPSKTFDLLKEDFDYILISVVLVALSVASIVVKHLSARKAIKQAWK